MGEEDLLDLPETVALKLDSPVGAVDYLLQVPLRVVGEEDAPARGAIGDGGELLIGLVALKGHEPIGDAAHVAEAIALIIFE